MKDIKLIVFFFLLIGFSYAQVDSAQLKKLKPPALKKLGKNAYRQNDPTTAIIYLESYVKAKPEDAVMKNMLAKSYMEIRDYERAQRMFMNAYNQDPKKAPDALYYHAQMQKSNMMYDSARINFQRFKKEYKGEEKVLKRQASKEIVFCDSVIKLVGIEYKIMIQHLDTNINKVNSEGAPTNLDDNTLLFTSLRTEKIEYIVEDDTAKSIKRKIYKAVRENGVWKFSGEFEYFNDEDANTGNVCFSPDRKRVYFTRCKPNMMDKMICHIYMSEKNGDTWSEPVKLPKPVNDPKYTSTMPTVTSDPKKGSDIIYFVSDRPKGKGGMDIWYTVYDKKKNEYKMPKNLGSKVNTSQDEITPFFDNETRVMYFSSDGLGGLGGFDIYRARGDGKRWTGTQNIGQPINSGADEVYYSISTNREEGFFVSNRRGGNALKNRTCCDDIYYYKHSEYIRIKLKGTVKEQGNESVAVPNATVDVYVRDKKSNDKFIIKTLLTDSLGNYETSIEPGQDYFVVVRKDDFLGTSGDVSTQGITMSKDINHDLKLAKKPKEAIHIPNVLYEFDKSNILASSQINLDTTVFRLMEANPELVIEIQSHTDSKGNELYNLKLSQKRAESVVKYLVGKGIAPERLKAQGYGESMPIAPNENPDGSDNPEGRAKNRRTDFKIIGSIDIEIIND